MLKDLKNRRVLTYVTSDYGHRYVRKISQEEGVRLVREAGLFERCGVEESADGACLINKYAAQVDPEKNIWVYNHDGTYWLTTPGERVA